MPIGEAVDVHGTIVLEATRPLSGAQRDNLRRYLANAWPGKSIIILEDGIRLSHAPELERLEVKLDAAIEILGQLVGALADEQNDGPRETLDGEPLPPDLPEGTEL